MGCLCTKQPAVSVIGSNIRTDYNTFLELISAAFKSVVLQSLTKTRKALHYITLATIVA